jgi:hypothetical protein
MDNDYAFIHETDIVLDRMFYILGFILKSVNGQQMKYGVYGVHIFRTLNTNTDKCLLVFCVLLPSREQNDTHI